jgi:hypothetical protein
MVMGGKVTISQVFYSGARIDNGVVLGILARHEVGAEHGTQTPRITQLTKHKDLGEVLPSLILFVK